MNKDIAHGQDMIQDSKTFSKIVCLYDGKKEYFVTQPRNQH